MRCVYHGWKFDLTGQCIDMPHEPAESSFRARVKATAYPTQEKAGILWTYMGPPHRTPPLPDHEWMRAVKAGCTSRRPLTTATGCSPWRAASIRLMRRSCNASSRSTAPRLEVLFTDYGYMYASVRHLPQERKNFVRIYPYLMPFYQLRAGGPSDTVGNTDGHMWVPIDDYTSWAWNFHFNITGPQSREEFDRFEHQMGRGPRTSSPARSGSRQTGVWGRSTIAPRSGWAARIPARGRAVGRLGV
jgi:phthalate 4,5-dioxygenase